MSRIPTDIDMDALSTIVDAVGGHTRSLVLLGDLIAKQGVETVANDIGAVIAELEEQYPGQRERSLISSVKLSLNRLPSETRAQIGPLAVVQGPTHVNVISRILEVSSDEALGLCRRLVAIGLAVADGSYLSPHPALAMVLESGLSREERKAAATRWLEATIHLVYRLYRQRFRDAMVALHGARTGLAAFLAALTMIEVEVIDGGRDPADAMLFAIRLEALVASLGIPRVLERVIGARQSLSSQVQTLSHAQFEAASEDIDRRLERGDRKGALEAARKLREQVDAAGDVAYSGFSYTQARAWWRLGRTLNEAGYADEALEKLDVALHLFEPLVAEGNRSAARMASVVISDRGDSLRNLGRLDDAGAAYEESIDRDKKLGDLRGVAVGSSQLGGLRASQGRLDEALSLYHEVRLAFEKLGEPRAMATAWHQIGMIEAEAQRFEAAEQAYKEALRLKASCGGDSEDAGTLHQLANLYDDQGRLEDAATLYRQSAEAFRASSNHVDESSARANLGIVLGKLGCFDEARQALTTAIGLRSDHGHAGKIWMPWIALEHLEREANRPAAADAARQEAASAYLSYRRDGGEPLDWPTRLIAEFAHTLHGKGPAAACAMLPDATDAHPRFLRALGILHAIADGNRERSLAEDPELYTTVAVELYLVLKSLLR